MDWAGIGIGVAATLMFLGILAFMMKRPQLAGYMPYISAAFKWAEAAVPDNTPNKSLAKVDAFLKKFNELYEAEKGKPPPKNVTELAMQGAQLLAAQAKMNASTQAAIYTMAGAIIKAIAEAQAKKAVAAPVLSLVNGKEADGDGGDNPDNPGGTDAGAPANP